MDISLSVVIAPTGLRVKTMYFLTGRPAIGKISVVLEVINFLEGKEYRVGGMVCQEKRENGSRVGFEVRNIETGKMGRLAHVNQPEVPRVG